MNFGWIMKPPDWAVEFQADIVDRLTRIESKTMALQDDLDAVAAEITAATAAVVAEIDALEAKIAAGDPVDLTGLRAAAAALDAVAVPPAA